MEEYLNAKQKEIIDSLTSPAEIQAFLDRTPYSTEEKNRTPVEVIQDGVAHCLDGALFAAAALRRLGFPPLLVDIFPEPDTDDDHVLAIYRCNGGYGALAKSNYPGLRSREPVHRSLRELVMSYFEWYFNVDGLRTLRSYTRPLSLAAYDRLGWTYSHPGVQAIEQRLLRLSRIDLVSPAMIAELTKVSPLTFHAGTTGVNPAGVYKPGSHKGSPV